MVKSQNRYVATITTSSGDLDPVVDHVRLRRVWNRADTLDLRLAPFDRLSDAAIDLTAIDRGDTVALVINELGGNAFYGEVIERQDVRTDTGVMVALHCRDRLGRLADRQLDRAIFNGFRDRLHWEVSTAGTAPLISTPLRANSDGPGVDNAIRPLISAEYFQPHGNWNPIVSSQLPTTQVDTLINYNTDPTRRRVAIMFTPRSSTIERVWVMMFDRGPGGDALETTVNASPFVTPIALQFQEVEDNGLPDPEEYAPSGTALTARSGATAEVSTGTAEKETWDGESGTDITVGPIGDLGWAITTGGTSNVDFITGGGFAFGSDAYAVLDYDGTNNVAIATSDPASFTNPSPSGWLTFQVRLQGASNAMSGRIEVEVDNRIAVRFNITGGDFEVEHNDGTETIISGYTLNRVYLFILRVRPGDRNFDAWVHDTTLALGSESSLGGFNLEFLDLKDFSTSPTTITDYRIIAEGPIVGDLEVGYVWGTEMGHIAGRLPGWTLFDFSSDPIDVDPRTWIAMELRVDAGAPLGNTDGVNVSVLNPNRANFDPDTRVMATSDDGTTWGEIGGGAGPTKGFKVPFIVEYSDSWRPALEGTEFVVDYDAAVVDWAAGTTRVAAIPRARFDSSTRVGPLSFTSVRTSEYINPSTDGVINPAGQMNSTNVVDELMSLSGSGFATNIDSSFDAIINDVEIVKQLNILQALRNIADRDEASFSITTTVTPTFNYEPTKSIASFDAGSPGVDEFVLSVDSGIFSDDDALRVISHNVGIAENETYTAFPVYGADVSLQYTFENWNLEESLGRRIVRAPEVFRKETNVDELARFSRALNDVHGLQLIEGSIEVDGYWPPDATEPGRLAINSLIRFIEPFLPNGDQISSGTGNVFKPAIIEYTSENNRTVIQLGNRNLHRADEERIEEIRNELLGLQPSNPNDDIRWTNPVNPNTDSEMPTLSESDTTIYIGLHYDSGATEVSDPGYIRVLAEQRIEGNYISYTAFFPPEVGVIPSDANPIDEIGLHPDYTSAATETIDTAADPIYKFSNRSLHVIAWVRNSDNPP